MGVSQYVPPAVPANRFVPDDAPVAPVRLLAPDGALLAETPPLSDAETTEALELMHLSRVFDQRATSLQRQGRFGTFSSVRGQEASVVGSALALDPADDWVAPQYRELPALLRQGLPLESFALYFMGHPAGGKIPEGVNMLPIQISLAAQLPQAVGLAWGLRLRGSQAVVLAYVGDGASSEGDFHEAVNLAGVMSAPVVFLVQNNGWAISTPRALQSAARTLAERGPGYGIEGVYVDGNDLFAVYATVSEAVAKARRGEGPTLIESLTWRAGPHNTADDPTKYVTPEDGVPWEGTDPVTRVEAYLHQRGSWNQEIAAEIRLRCENEVERALDVALAQPPAGPEALFDHVYAEPPERLLSQRSRWSTA